MAVVITGKNLTVEEVVSVARGGELVEISLDSQKAVKNARDYVEKKLSEGTVIYGLTTGFGKFSDKDEVITGGNFHGQPMALAFDFIKMAIAEFADVSERRSERLIDPQLSEGLAPFLTNHGGVCSGFMIAQYAAASMVSENKIYAHPACVDSIPSSGNQEDHVSMGTTSARTAALILDNAQKVLGIELFAASQAIWLRGDAKGEEATKSLAPATKAAYDFIRKTVKPIDNDIVMHYELIKFDAMIKNHSFAEEVSKVVKIC